MRYTYPLKRIRRGRHKANISIAITVLLLALILFLGFTEVDARQFFGGFGESFVRVSIAYAVSLILAIAMVVFLATSALIETIFLPVLDALQSFPSFAVFPLLLVWLGRTSAVTVIILVIEMIWPILFTLLSAQKQLKTDLLEAGSIFGATGTKRIRYVLFPLLFPALVTGSIVAWGEAWEAIIAAEIIVAVPGVGTYLGNLGTANSTGTLLVGILLLLLILYIVNKYLWLTLLNLSTRYQQE
ncbi:ABC transporter permease subunit [Candidatus Gottesmanbacteria bacterium]|nr:ABC transporter permease subunit [Candidatus Gottesmanbacteria bacterium]